MKVADMYTNPAQREQTGLDYARAYLHYEHKNTNFVN